MFPLLLSVLSGVRELSATASLAEFQQPGELLELLVMPGVSSKELVASLCPIAVAFVVATIRYYNEKQVKQRALDPYPQSSPGLLPFGDVDTASHSNCGDFNAAVERRRSDTFYVSDNSIVIFRVRDSLYSAGWALAF